MKVNELLNALSPFAYSICCLDADFKQTIGVSAANTLYKKHESGSTKLSFGQRVGLCHRQPSETLTPLPMMTFYEHQNMLKARATNTPTTLATTKRRQ
jgi:hypothetical protein